VATVIEWEATSSGAPSGAKHAFVPLHDLTCELFLMSAMAPSAALPRAAPGAPAEEQAAAFEDDPRVHLDTQSGRWRLEDGDAEFEYEPFRAVWIPVVSPPLPTPQLFECVWTLCARCY
jgi:hypothetical protein